MPWVFSPETPRKLLILRGGSYVVARVLRATRYAAPALPQGVSQPLPPGARPVALNSATASASPRLNGRLTHSHTFANTSTLDTEEGVGQSLGVERFAKVAVHTGVETALLIASHGVGGECDHGDRAVGAGLGLGLANAA